MSRRQILDRATPSARRSLPGIVLGVLADASVVGLLALSMWLIVKSGEQPPILHLTFAIVGVRALAIGRAAFRYTERVASHDAALYQLSTLRAETFTALVPRVPGAIESSRRGDVLATFVDDVDQLQDQPLRVRQPMIVSLIVTGLTVIAVAIVSPLAALILALVLAISAGFGAWLSRRIGAKSDRELATARAELSDALLDRFAAAEVLAAFGAMPKQRERIRAAEARLTDIQLTRTKAAGSSGAIVSVAAGVASLVTLLVATPAVTTGALSTPLFAAIVVVPAAVFEVFAQVFAAFTARRAVEASADRVAALSDTALPAEIPTDPETAASLPESLGTTLLAVEDFSVSYPGGVTVIDGLSFAVHAGELLVVTGDSGAGKSTLALGLTRLLDYRGSYEIAGVEARTLAGADVRSVVGLCEQRPHLFDSDIRQNLKFAKDTASDEELMSVLARVGLAEWAADRGGLDAPVGERGALVSGGQAQRISLARAILADFPVVILDEPTAGVDRQVADRLLADLLGAIPADRAVILITHTELPDAIREAGHASLRLDA